MDQEQSNREIFKPLEAYIRTETYSASAVYELIAEMTTVAPQTAYAFSMHARDICVEAEDEFDFTDLTVEMYWRTFFSPKHAPMYGTAEMVADPIMLENMVNFIKNPARAVADASAPSLARSH